MTTIAELKGDLDERLERLEGKVGRESMDRAAEARLDMLAERMDILGDRVDKLVEKVDKLSERIDKVDTEKKRRKLPDLIGAVFIVVGVILPLCQVILRRIVGPIPIV